MVVNLTTHPFHIVRVTGETTRHHGRVLAKPADVEVIRTIEPSGRLARSSPHATLLGNLNGCPVRYIERRSPTGLPEPDGETVYVVGSRLIEAAAASGRTTEDLISPFMLVRDVDNPNVVLGNLSFQRVVPAADANEGKSTKGAPKRLPSALPDSSLVNLLPFAVNMVQVEDGALEDDGSELFYADPAKVAKLATLKPSNHTARRAHNTMKAVDMHGLMVHPTSYGPVNQLPEPDGKTMYIVSGPVLSGALANGRSTGDLLVPGGMVRVRGDESVSLGHMFLDTISTEGTVCRGITSAAVLEAVC